MEMQIALNQSNIQTPRSIACFDDAQIIDAASTMEGRFMLEPNRRELGAGVVSFHTVAELKDHLASGKFIRSVDNITLVQKYVNSRIFHAAQICKQNVR